MQFKELTHFLENITITDLAPHFISYLKDHRYIMTKNIAFEFLKTIDGSITPRSEIYKKFRIKLITRLKCLTKKALDLGYLKKYSPRVYETTNKIKKTKTHSEIMPLLLDSLNHKITRFLDINPNTSLKELYKIFPDQNKGTISHYRSCFRANSRINKNCSFRANSRINKNGFATISEKKIDIAKKFKKEDTTAYKAIKTALSELIQE